MVIANPKITPRLRNVFRRIFVFICLFLSRNAAKSFRKFLGSLRRKFEKHRGSACAQATA
jgi:hypothetical protein